MKNGKVEAIDIKKALAAQPWKDFFLTECKSGSTWMTRAGDMKILDGLAIRKSWSSPCFTGYEVKVSRGDFLRDAKFYTYEELVNCLYIVCPKGMIDRTELPESVGLMYYDPEKKTLQTKKKAIYRKIEYSADMLLYIIYSRLDSDRLPFYSEKQEYFRDYVDGKKTSQDLGHIVRSKLVQENADLEREIEDVKQFKEQRDEYLKIKEVLRKHGIYGWRHRGGAAEELDEALKMKCPEDIKDIRIEMETLVRRMKKMEGSE